MDILYDFNGRTLALLGDLSQPEIDQCIDRLLRFNNDRRHKSKPVTLYIASNLGTIPQFLRLYDILQLLHYPVVTIGLGQIQGVGGLLLACGTKGKRWLLPHTLIGTQGIIDATEDIPGSPIGLMARNGSPREKVREMSRNHLINILTKELYLPPDFIATLAMGGAVHTATEAVNIGLADAIYHHNTINIELKHIIA